MEDPMINIPEGHILIESLKLRVQNAMKVFIYRFENIESGEEFLIKAPFNDDVNVESLWVEIESYDKERGLYTGKITNEPRDIKNYKFGEKVEVNKKEVDDLMIIKNGSYEGGFLAALAEGREAQIQDKRPILVKLGLKK